MQPGADHPSQVESPDGDLASRRRPSVARALLGPLLAGLLAALIVLAVAFPTHPPPHGSAQNAPR